MGPPRGHEGALPRTVNRVGGWLSAHRTELANAGTLAGSTIVTSLLGLAFWGAAARLFPPATVGVGSAAVSAMMLLGTVGMIGLGTLMIGELPIRPSERGRLLATALAVAATAGGVVWGMAVAALGLLAGTPSGIGGLVAHPLFGLGIVLTAVVQVLDQALIGLLRGALQLWRNLAFAIVKLAALVALGLVAGDALASQPDSAALGVVATWVAGLAASLAWLAALLLRERTAFLYRPAPRLLRGLSVTTLQHHLLNLALYGPRLVLPVVAATVVSADAAAAFYAAWMLVSFAFMVPAHFSTVLHAVGASDPEALAERLRFSLRTSLTIGVVAGVALLVAAPLALRVFGAFYAELATDSLRVLVLVIPAMTAKLHLVAIERVRRRLSRITLGMTVGATLEVGLAWLGASQAGILGLAWGYSLAVVAQALVATPPLMTLLRDHPASRRRQGPSA